MDPKSKQEDMYAGSLKLVDINGIPLFSDTAEIWDLLSAFKARPDDLLICTYPKAGTTWVQEIADMIQHGGEPQKIPMFKRMPFIEINFPLIAGINDADVMPSPRMLKTHLPVQLLPTSFWEQNCKIIYVARNGKDNAVSYFHFHRMNKGMPDPGTWDEFLEKFLSGKLVWGSWFDHVRGWWEAKNRHQILYLFYEDMKEDLAREVRKVAQFMGYELSESTLNHIVQQTKFDRMKDNPMANYSTLPTCDQTVSPFMRKGVVGDWKENFTVAQTEQFDEACARLLAGSGLSFRTQL